MTVGLTVLAAVLAGAAVFGAVWRRRTGALRPVAPAASAAVLTAERLGRPLGARGTLVQFSTAFCAPCRATRRILSDVAAMADGVTHVEIDAEANLGLVRDLRILATPTVFVLAADGTILRRATGQPRKADVIAALDAIAGPAGARPRPTG